MVTNLLLDKQFLNSTVKRNQQLKFEIWDVIGQFETDAKVVGSNLVKSI